MERNKKRLLRVMPHWSDGRFVVFIDIIPAGDRIPTIIVAIVGYVQRVSLC
jgi:hypothetical protein